MSKKERRLADQLLCSIGNPSRAETRLSSSPSTPPSTIEVCTIPIVLRPTRGARWFGDNSISGSPSWWAEVEIHKDAHGVTAEPMGDDRGVLIGYESAERNLEMPMRRHRVPSGAQLPGAVRLAG